MFRDTKEELERLERALLAEEEQEKIEEADFESTNFEEEPEEEWDSGFDALLDDPDDFGEENPSIYHNYSNGYGRKQPVQYNAYHSNQTDENPVEFSEAVQEPRQRDFGFIAVVCILLLGIAGVLLWCVLHFFQ